MPELRPLLILDAVTIAILLKSMDEAKRIPAKQWRQSCAAKR